jgi:hypothetical protein
MKDVAALTQLPPAGAATRNLAGADASSGRRFVAEVDRQEAASRADKAEAPVSDGGR